MTIQTVRGLRIDFVLSISGLLTFADGTNGLPRNEGFFEGTKLVERRKTTDVVTRARQVGQRAHAVQL